MEMSANISSTQTQLRSAAEFLVPPSLVAGTAPSGPCMHSLQSCGGDGKQNWSVMLFPVWSFRAYSQSFVFHVAAEESTALLME